MPHGIEVKVVLGEQNGDSTPIPTEKVKTIKNGMGEEGLKDSSQGLKNGTTNGSHEADEVEVLNGQNGHQQQLTNGDKSNIPCDDPAIIAKLSDFTLYTDGLRDNNFDESEVTHRPKKIYRVVLTGGK